MKNTSKITKKWWMIFKRFPPEPPGLWVLYIFAVSVTLELFLIAGFCAYHKHGTFYKEPEITCNTSSCIKQKDFWNKFIAEANKDKEAATKKMKLLKNLRWNPDIKNIERSWSWFETEINQLKEIIERPKKLHIASIKDTFTILFIGVFCSLIFFILINRLILFHARSIQNYFVL